MSEDCLLGIDLGGTKIAAGVFDDDRKLLGEIVTAPTQADQPGEVTLANIERAARQALGDRQPVAIGIGSTGPVDAETGRILEATSLPNLNFFDLGEWVETRFDAPMFIENDANCFALGEAMQGGGMGHSSVVAVTLGTGFGCGIVLDGAMYSGVTGNAGEVANCPVAGDTYDNMLSGAGVRRFYERVRGPSELSAREIGDLAEAGDADALAAWRYYGDAVGAALGTIAAILDPSICVVGGSVSARLALFREPMERRLRAILAPGAAARIQVAPARLGPAAGVIGAAEYAFYRTGSLQTQRHEGTKTTKQKKLAPIPADFERVAAKIVDAALEVHRALGPGLLESVYEICLVHALHKRGVPVERQLATPVVYDSVRLEAGLRLDLLAGGCVVVEVKALESILPVHQAQLLTYLKLSGHRLGLLINFNVPLIRDGIKRVAF